MPDFPRTLSFVTGRKPRRLIRGEWSVTEILALDAKGKRATQNTPGAQFGVYLWNGREWQLDVKCNSPREAKKAAARIRQRHVAGLLPRPNSN
jgi:hypothetical protein